MALAAAGVTDLLVPVTAPTPLSMLSEVAPLTLQLNVVDWPATTTAGLAVNVEMAGNGGGCGATVTVAVAVALPALLDALSV